jgi:hypothetical protein
MMPYREERFPQEISGRILLLRYPAGLGDHKAASQVEALAKDFLDVLDARLLSLGPAEPLAKRAAKSGQFEIMRAKEVEKLAPSGLGKAAWRQVADGVDLDTGNAQSFGLGKSTPHTQSQAIDADAES